MKTPAFSGVKRNTRSIFWLMSMLLLPFVSMAQVALRGTATTATSTTTTLTIPTPAGVVAGDILIANIATMGTSSAASLTGWTVVRSNSLSTGPNRYATILYKIAGASEPASFSFATGTGTIGASGAILAFSGVNTTTPFDVSTQAIRETTASTVTATGITTVNTNVAIVYLGQAVGSTGGSSVTWTDATWRTSSSPGALTELYDIQQTTNRVSVGAAWGTRAAIGATGNGTVTLSASVRNGGTLIALRPIDVFPPVVSAQSPAANATGISISTTITADFNEPMTASTINTSTATLQAGTTTIPATVSYSSTSRRVTMTPSMPLAARTVYTVTLRGGSAGIKDAAGLALASDYTWNFTSANPADQAAPTVTTVTPAVNATGVATSTTVTATFNEALSSTTVNTGTAYLRNGTTNITATVSYSSTNRRITLTPSAALLAGTTYTATIKGGLLGVKDAAGNPLAADYTWSFTTVGTETIAPTVVSTIPATNAVGVAVTVPLTITVSEALNASSVSGTTVLLQNGATAVPATVAYTAGTTTITLTPTASLAFSTIYTATVKGGTTGIKDVAGNALAADYTWSFTTAAAPDGTPPVVFSTNPASNATEVSATTALSATVSEALNATTVNGTTVFLQNGTTAIPATVAYQAGATSITITPTAPLPAGATITATIRGGTNGVKDVAGNALAADYTWTFTVSATDLVAPTVGSTTPASNAINVPLAAAITATFSEALNATTVNSTNVILQSEATTVTATVVYTPGSTQVTIQPAAALNGGTVYTVTLKGGAGGIADPAGNTLAADYSWSFTTLVQDLTAPTVVSTIPASAATGIVPTTAIAATVSEALDPTSVTTTNVFLQAGASTISTTLSYTAGSTNISLTPTTTLNYNTTYTVTIKGGATGVEDLAGNPLAADYTWSFTTGAAPDQTAPTVLATVPASNAINVSISSQVSITVSEALDPASLTTTNVSLRIGNTVVSETIGYTPGSTTVTLSPASALAYATLYTVTLKGGAGGVRDLAGNTLAADYTWTFTTESAPSGGGNEIVAENALPGNAPAEWDVSGSGDPTIQGFATDISVNRGSVVRFKINVTGSNTAYGIRIYRLGYYNGNGARLIADLGSFTGVTQPSPTVNTTLGLVDYDTWSESATWTVPSNAVSGVYIAKLTRASNGGASHIVFVVRNDASTAPIMFKTSDATWQAYNSYGGYSFYGGSTGRPSGRADKVSYNRPFNTRDVKPECYLFNAEYPMIRWMERNGYHMTYVADVDMERNTTTITPSKHQMLMSVGHDEYWSLNMRNNYENARNAGVHLAFFSGNEVYWKTRWENNNRTLVCYKEGAATGQGEYNCGGNCDPATGVWTGLWRFGCEYGEDGCRPENALTGQLSWTESSHSLQVPYEFANLPFWRNTSVASLQPGQTAVLGTSILGYEWNFEQPAFASTAPAGRITMSSTTQGGLNHRLSLYTHNSGAIVFGAGTVQWSWGLDGVHDRGNTTPSRDLQQATLNLFTEMGLTAGSLQADLIVPTAISDRTAPVSAITAPVHGSTVVAGSTLTITGTASDNYALNRVEVSVDGGLTWQPASGTTNWTFSWTVPGSGTIVIKSRAIDNNGNAQAAGNAPSANAVSVTVSGGTGDGCPCTIFTNQLPAISNQRDNTVGIVVGTRFRANVNGFVTGLRFYKGAGNLGTHTGQLYSSSGTLLASAVYTNETASGWQTVTLSNPVAITAGVNYIVTYHSSQGYYSTTNAFFANSVVNGPLTAPAGISGAANGVYLYSATPVFPTDTYQQESYFVDVIFATSTTPDATAPTVQAVSPANGATSVAVNTAITASFSESLNASTVNGTNVLLTNNGNSVPASISYTSGSQNLTITPTSTLSNGTTYTVTLKGGSTGLKDPAGNALAADYTWSFTTISVAADLTPPVSTITSPLNGTSLTVNQAVTIAGTASDAGGVNRVEVSVDGGNSWQTATGTTSWTYSWTPTVTGAATIRSRAVDNANNTEATGTPPAQNAINVTVSTVVNPCPCTVFNTGQAVQPTSSVSKNDGSGLNLGMKFVPNQNGYITALRFYKSATNTGTHTGQLYSASGTLLASIVFTNETASGWQQADLTTPVAVSSGTTYIVSYHSSAGNYSSTENYFTAAVTSGPLTAPSSASSGGNGLYFYSSSPAMPVSSYNASNYWVDAVFNTVISGAARLGAVNNDMQDGQQAPLMVRGLPVNFNLAQNAPNPASGRTVIAYSLPVKGKVQITLFDMQGRKVKTLVDEVREAGTHRIEVDLRSMGQGMYFYKMQAEGFSATKRMLIE